ncbi:aminoacyl-histidine dipeptidase [Polaribacter sp.]|nr:aminoacyl-histidine dipeptidase [Polaribacter sp.]
MSKAVRNLAPKLLWNHFADLNAVPRPSKKEEEVIQFIVDFATKLYLEYSVDAVGNVIVRKKATNGFEDRKTVILQSHLDMVHQKNNDTVFDFETQGIEMYVDNDWVTANGTTLGADNGLGVATIMAILSSQEIEHPDLEALFTIDEETGMTGAMGLQPNLLHGEILLNLDTEEDDEIGIGCAGGVDITASKNYSLEKTPENSVAFSIEIKGLQGGHSGMDIHKGLANANKLINRVLYQIATNLELRIASIHGGSLRNAIPRESKAVVTIQENLVDVFHDGISKIIEEIKSEYCSLEPNLSIQVESSAIPNNVIDFSFQEQLLKAVYAAHNGVYRLSPDIENLVETSNNIAKVTVSKGTATVECLTRSSSNSGKTDLSNTLKATFELAGFKVSFSGEYPGWQPNPSSEIVKKMTKIYTGLFNSTPNVMACHAGLECGILGQNYPNVDMVSFGPTIKGAHSPDERASISSTQKFWKFLVEILKNIPKKHV